MEKLIQQAGFNSVKEFFIKVALPGLVISIAVFFSTMLFLPLPFWVSYIFLAFGVGIIFAFPYIMTERKRVEINETIHLFITFGGTIATIDLNRNVFFQQIADTKDYGYISELCSKILYFAKSWNLGFAVTCRRVAVYSPSRIFGDFLDRFAAALDFGESLETFLIDEQAAVLDDYETIYKEALNNIGMIREAFIAVTISIAFGMSTALMLPLLMGVSILIAIKWCLFILFVIDAFLVFFISAFIPSDDLCHNLKIKDEGTKKIVLTFQIAFPFFVIILGTLFYIDAFSFLFNIAIALTPFLITGWFAVQEENDVFKRDKEFPAFIRALGATIFARQGGVMTSLEALQVHDFGSLQNVVNNLYTRLKIGSDKMKSWAFFAGESGSNLISKFVLIFAKSIYLGGHAEKIGQIISENFQRLISLRKLRYQQASALRGALYGSMVGFIATVYISVSITQLLTKMFSQAMAENSSQGSVSSMIGSIIPTMPEVDPSSLSVYLGLVILLHAFVSALVLKVVDGGNRFAMIFDFVGMVWIGAGLSWIVPSFAYKLFAGSMGLS